MLRPLGAKLTKLTKQNIGLVFVLLVFLAAICVVNPIRETLGDDDGWSYARSVRYLLDTGSYRLDSWAAANMPAQIFLAAGLSEVFGYSISILRISTLIVFAFGLIAFYRLLRDFGSNDKDAAVLTFGLLCSPLVLLLSFSFMTDVQFMSWMIVALWLYTRAIRLNSARLMLLASLPAAAAIGTRQFGVALVGGLLLAWLFKRRTRRFLLIFFVGLPAPLAVAAWQIQTGTENPNFTQIVRLCEQAIYVRQGLMGLLGELVWRPTILLENIGLFLIALLPLIYFPFHVAFTGQFEIRKIRRPDCPHGHRFSVFLFAAWVAFIGAGLLYGTFASEIVNGRVVRQSVMPSTPWLVEYLTEPHPSLRPLLTIVGVPAAIMLGFIVSLYYLKDARWRRMTAEEMFVILTSIAFLVLHLLYVQFNDTYAITFLPFVLFVLGQILKDMRPPWWLMRAIIAAGFLCVVLTLLLIRGDFERREALWMVADRLHARGIEPVEISTGTVWEYYQSAFDDWVSEVAINEPIKRYCGPYLMHDAFNTWEWSRMQRARYQLSVSNSLPECPICGSIAPVEFRDKWLQKRYVYVVTSPNN